MYQTPLRAFQALDANPANLGDFLHGTRNYKPPLSREQAVYAFMGLDADHDGALPSFEFFEVMEGGKFFPTLRDLVVLGVPQKQTTTQVHTTTTLQQDRGIEVHQLFYLFVGLTLLIVPFICCELCKRLSSKGSYKNGSVESYEVVGSPGREPDTSSRTVREAELNSKQGSRIARSTFGQGGLLSCCLRASDETEEVSAAAAAARYSTRPLLPGAAGRAANASQRTRVGQQSMGRLH